MKQAAKILIVDDDADVLTAARVVLRQRFETVITEANPQRIAALLEQNPFDVILLDMNYSAGRSTGNEGLFWLQQILSTNRAQQVIMITAYGDIKLAVEAMKLGAADFIVKPWENEKLEATVQAAFQFAQTKKELDHLKSRQSQISRIMSAPESELIGTSEQFKKVLQTASKVALSDANVLLLGENGTGKELVAKFIHNNSLRKDHPFVKVDVGAIASSLFESELFGHRKGAFTDAKDDRTGRMELANGGTLFLDEVGNIPIGLQSKLLSALQNREVVAVGSNKPAPIDVRLISATNLDISESVQRGEFREDLLYRINTVEILIPPLRERVEDIPLIAQHFLKMYAARYRKESKSLTPDALRVLQKHNWPGNVRELQHAIERAVIMSDSRELSKNDFLFTSRKAEIAKKDDLNLDEMERKTIQQALNKHSGNMSKVAKELGVGRTTLYRKITKYGLDKP